MRALIDPTVFASTAASSLDVVALFRFAEVGRHSVFPDPLEAAEFKTWLGERDPEIRERCEFAIESGLDLEKRRPPTSEIRVTATAAPRWLDTAELPLDVALQLLSQPLSVVVEGARSDRDFLLAVADRHQRQALMEGQEKQWLRFDHGGGLEEMWERLREMGPRPQLIRRSFWIFDSDALAPDLPSPESERLRRLCKRYRAQFHRLARRTAENYIPLPALREIWARQKSPQTRKRKVRAFEKLGSSQRHHFNMKSGLAGDRERIVEYERRPKTSKIASEAEKLYEGLETGIREVLQSGFGSKIRDLFRHDLLLRQEGWFEGDGLRDETRPMIETLLACR